MKRSELRQELIDTLRVLPDKDIFSLWNEYCENSNYYDDRLEYMDSFDELYSGCSPLEIAMTIRCGCDEGNDETAFNPNRDYFYLNGCGNPVSIDYLGWVEWKGDYLYPNFDEDGVIDYVIEYEDALGCDELQDVLDEIEDDEDDED